MKSYHFILLSIFSGFLLFAGWPTSDLTFTLFIGWVPLFFIEEAVIKSGSKKTNLVVFGCSYLAFFIWNVLTTWWIWNASAGGAVMAIVCNALLMCIPFLLFHITKRNLGNMIGYFSLIIYWLAFEYIHLRWELTWPWLTLGNGFSMQLTWIQWYEYTGVMGGSLWILLSNLVLFLAIKEYLNRENKPEKIKKIFSVAYVVIFILLVIMPILISHKIYNNYQEKTDPVNVVVVQPNIDPYTEKFDGLSTQEQLEKIIRLSGSLTDSLTDYLVWPETAIPQGLWLNQLQQAGPIIFVKEFLKKYPNLTLITGISAYQQYDSKASVTAREFSNGVCCYDAFNTAIQLDQSGSIPVYHKSKLVPGVERMPYPIVFGYLESLAIDLGGIVGSLGTQKERGIFKKEDKNIKIAPVICYESVFGDYFGEYVAKGANLAFIITNDAWWGNTPGHRQHLHYASLRAIEQRRSFARSANTGISCFINQKGEILQATKYEEDAVITGKINLNNIKTFYSVHGDYLGRISCFFSILLIVLSIVSIRTFKFKYRLNKIG